MGLILAIDQGTTSSRSVLFDANMLPGSLPLNRNFNSITLHLAGWNMTLRIWSVLLWKPRNPRCNRLENLRVI